MNIVVLVKQVPDVNAIRIDTATGIAKTSGKAMNSFDAYAMRHAISLKAQYDAEVIVVSAGPAQAKDSLTRALAMGADRGIHIELTDQDVRDSLDMAKVLAEAVRPLEPSIVLCGQQSDDIETGQIGPQIAELLGMPHASSVMSVDAEGETLRMRRDTESGYQWVEAPLPVVVIVGPGMDEPPYPSIKGMMAARRKPVEMVAAVEMSDAHRLSWSEPTAPQRESEGILVQGESAHDAAKKLVAWMQEHKLIAT